VVQEEHRRTLAAGSFRNVKWSSTKDVMAYVIAKFISYRASFRV
jgi:hypothetical protein